jgi:DNA replication and repair protein RecF
MRVKTLTINNLRNIESAQIELDSVLSCFIGANGAGKTSILESLVVLSKGRSFRSGQLSSLIGPTLAHFQVVSDVESSTHDRHRLGMERGTQHWAARHNGEDVTQLSELTELLPYVLLEPSSYTLIDGPPDGRRKYMDWGVFHVEHAYLPMWRRYSRALKQRNAALRRANADVIASLDPQFVDLGEKIHTARLAHTEMLVQMLTEIMPVFNNVLGGINIQYSKGWSGESLSDSINASLQRDTDRGATGPGPHRADLTLTLDGAPAKDRLSRGEQKSLTAALLMAQAKMICSSGDKPVLLLDDVASELDEAHLNNVLAAGKELGVQILLTGTELPAAVDASGLTYTVFHVEHGTVSKKL